MITRLALSKAQLAVQLGRPQQIRSALKQLANDLGPEDFQDDLEDSYRPKRTNSNFDKLHELLKCIQVAPDEIRKSKEAGMLIRKILFLMGAED